ncbi:MAG: bacterial Ig-like domain-containing protein, partial [Oscillospiraceae bacterium]|nr:bacterial Ig-like domain-containing protein [Oscillospiraceae bacterium]
VSTWNYVKGVDQERITIKKKNEDKDVKIEIIQKPNKLVYNVGEKLDTNGLVIKQIYETGRSFTTSSGFTVDKSLLKIGDNEVTVSYEGKTATFNIIINLLKGDSNNDGIIDVADVVAVASYVGNPEANKLDSQGMINADVHNTGNGLTADDALMIQQYIAKIIDKL